MSAHYDIIPDIHGHAEKLRALLGELGYERRGGRWQHDESRRQIVFLGDFIDRGPDNLAVLETVRDLIADGRALAVMGNHELNAIHFHNDDPDTGRPLRPHSEKNLDQHETFLREFPAGSDGAHEWTDWMSGLPLWLDLGPFRVVHACWSAPAVRRLALIAPGGVLSRDGLLRAGRYGDPLNEDVEVLTKGPEKKLPPGHGFTDKGGHRRDHVRIAWWRSGSRTWREAAISVPNAMELPDEPLPAETATEIYPAGEKPVFFGHYWLEDAPVVQAPNALCLDYSAGLGDNPLVAYAWEPGMSSLQVEAIVGAGGLFASRQDAPGIERKARAMREAWETLGPIAVIRDLPDEDDEEFAVAVGRSGAPGPVVIYPRAGGGIGMPLPDSDREIARYEDWRDAAAAGWRSD